MPEWIIEHWAKWLFGILGAAVSAGAATVIAQVKGRTGKAKLQKMESEVTAVDQRLEGVEKALRASMYDRLYYLHGKYMKQGWVSVPDLENIAGIYEGYHGLGGNGVGTMLYEDLCKLPKFQPM